MDINYAFTKPIIDRSLGLDRYEGDEKIYENVLESFDRNNKDTLKNLKNAIHADDRKLAHRIAHSLRGAAGTIGATRLADAILPIESLLSPKKAACDFHIGETFKKHMALLESEFNAVFAEFNLLLKKKVVDGCDLKAISREKTLNLIDRLTPLLESGDANSLEYLDEIDENFRPAAEEFQLFITQMESYDFDQALETLNNIRKFMGHHSVGNK